MRSRVFFIVISIFFTCQVNANLALSKYRLVFDPSTRANALQLRNIGQVNLNYTAELGLMEMTEEGTLHRVESSAHAATDFIRFSPRRGSIAPGAKQALRFALRKPAGLAAGEYRAVLRLSSTLDASQTGNVSLNSTLAYNVPIIVRHGRVQAQTSLIDAQLVRVNDVPHIQLWQTLDGNRSVFGNFRVTDRAGDELGVLNNVSVYPPLMRRRVLIPLQQDGQGEIRIEYQEVAEYGGNLTAEAQLTL